MSTESDIDIRLHRRRWIACLLGHARFRLELQLTPSIEVATEADTVRAAWDGAVAAVDIFHGVKITSQCPYDDKGRQPTETEES